MFAKNLRAAFIVVKKDFRLKYYKGVSKIVNQKKLAEIHIIHTRVLHGMIYQNVRSLNTKIVKE